MILPAKDLDRVLYKNSDLIKIYPVFANPKNLRNSAGIDEEFIKEQENLTTSPTIISLSEGETDTNIQQEKEFKETNIEINNDSESLITEKSETINQSEQT
jgi:hypothetical protein